MFFFFFDNDKKIECNSIREYIDIVTNKIYKDIKLYNKDNYYQFYHGSAEAFINFGKYFKAIREQGLTSLKPANPKFFFRGENSNSYDLCPSVFRNNLYERESNTIKKVKSECSQKINQFNYVDQLVFLQHYNCPTRLLDVTNSALVALYFACKESSNNSNSDEGIVYVFVEEYDKLCYADSDKILLLSCLAKLNLKEKEELYSVCMDNLSPLILLDDENENSVVKKFISEVKKESPSFVARINPIDLLSNYFFIPNKNNTRIIRQDGAFVISGLNSNNEELSHKYNNSIFKKIIINNKKKILEDLNKLGINETTLFPEVDQVSKYFKNIL